MNAPRRKRAVLGLPVKLKVTDKMQNVPAPMTSATGLQELTSRDCTYISKSLTESLDYFGVTVHERSDLGTMIREISWMGSFGAAPFLADGAIGVDNQRTLRAFLYVLQARDIARTLEACRDVKGDIAKIKKIRKKLDRLRHQDAPAQNTLFELEVAGMLTRAGLDVELSEPPRPDVVCHFKGAAIGLECKRVQNRDRLREQLKVARKQSTNQDLPAAAIIDVQPLLYRTNDPDRPVYFDQVESIEELRNIQSERLRQLALSITDDVEKAFVSGVGAVVLCAMTWAMSRQPSAYVWCWIVEPLAPKTDDGIALENLLRVILRQR